MELGELHQRMEISYYLCSMREEPTNRELKIMMDNIERKFDEKMEDIVLVLKDIKSNTGDLRKDVDNLKLWQKLVIGGGIVVITFGAVFANLYIKSIARDTALEILDNR